MLPIGLPTLAPTRASLGGDAMSTLLVLVIFTALVIAIWIVVIRVVGRRKDPQREFAAAAVSSAGATLLVWPKYEQEAAEEPRGTGRSVGTVEILATAGAALLIRRPEAQATAVSAEAPS